MFRLLPSQTIRSLRLCSRPFSTSATRLTNNADERIHPNAAEHRDYQTKRLLNKPLERSESSQATDLPSVGKDILPPELLSSSASSAASSGAGAEKKDGELEVGEIEGGKFKVEPKRRTGEDEGTMKSRLQCELFTIPMPQLSVLRRRAAQPAHANVPRLGDQSRKRGTLESDLLLSTFADRYLPLMNIEQLRQYDLFLDENDWDIYYWATQEAPSSSTSSSTSSSSTSAPSTSQQQAPPNPRPGEWAQTVGTFKAAYRPVPARWRDSDLLALLRRHVRERSSGGVGFGAAKVEGEGLAQSVKGTGGGGLGRMPEVKVY